MSKTAIIVPYNTQYELTIECLDKLQATTVGEDLEVILVHGRVNDDDVPIMHDFVTKYIHLKNESYCKTINAGLRAISPDVDFVFLMGNDSFPLQPGWLSGLKKLYKRYDLAVLSPDYTAGGKRGITIQNSDLWYHDMIPSIHYFMSKEVLDTVGLMDERFEGACYYSDDDYCIRVNRLYGSHKIARCKNIVFEHRMSQEGKALGFVAQMKINEKIFREKWH